MLNSILILHKLVATLYKRAWEQALENYLTMHGIPKTYVPKALSIAKKLYNQGEYQNNMDLFFKHIEEKIKAEMDTDVEEKEELFGEDVDLYETEPEVKPLKKRKQPDAVDLFMNPDFQKYLDEGSTALPWD
jgi:hypothetical protein